MTVPAQVLAIRATEAEATRLITVLPKDSLEQGVPLALEMRFAPAADISFRTIAGHNVLFNEADQKLLEVNDTAAYIWCAIADGLGYETILHELVSHGLASGTAKGYLDAAFEQWTSLGFVKPVSEPVFGTLVDKAGFHQDIQVAGTSIRIRYATSLAPTVAPIFEHLEIRDVTPDTVLDVVERNGQIDLFRNGDWLFCCSHEEIATTLKGHLMDEVLEGAAYELALHAATLVRSERALLVCGHPGAGKTTLTLALVEAGFGFAGDDLALLNSQGLVTGVPFAPAVKAGAWNLVAAFRPDIRDMKIFRRPDRRRVRYPAPRSLVSAAAYPVDWLVLLDRHPDAEAALTPVDPVSAIRWMLKESYAQSRKLSTAGFKAVSDAIERASYYRLTYSRLEDAVELLDRICR